MTVSSSASLGGSMANTHINTRPSIIKRKLTSRRLFHSQPLFFQEFWNRSTVLWEPYETLPHRPNHFLSNWSGKIFFLLWFLLPGSRRTVGLRRRRHSLCFAREFNRVVIIGYRLHLLDHAQVLERGMAVNHLVEDTTEAPNV